MSSFKVNLNNLDLMKVSGPDSIKLLQGQVTCDVASLSAPGMTRGAVCNIKGRVITDFRLYHAHDSFFLEMSEGMYDILEANLKKFLPFYKTEVQNDKSSYQRFGLSGIDAEKVLEQIFTCLPTENELIVQNGCMLGNAGKSNLQYILWLDQSILANTVLEKIDAIEDAPYSNWEYLNLISGNFQISPSSSSLYTPQELNYDLTGLVDFNKGCYTGQEIVARMHYRGNKEKRMYRVIVEGHITDSQALLNTEITDDVGKVKGKVIKVFDTTNKKKIELLVIFNQAPGDSSLIYSGDTSLELTYQPFHNGT